MEKSKREFYRIDQPETEIQKDILSIFARCGITFFLLRRGDLYFKATEEQSLVTALKVLRRDYPQVTVSKVVLANKDTSLSQE